MLKALNGSAVILMVAKTIILALLNAPGQDVASYKKGGY